MLKRPSPKDTEEDLLRFQDEFLASIGKLPNEAHGKGISVGTNLASTEKEQRPAVSVYRKQDDQVVKVDSQKVDDDDEAGDAAWFPDSSSVVLGDIVERDFDMSKLMTTATRPESGFPEPERMPREDLLPKSSKSSGKMSLFARKMLEKQQKNEETEGEIVEVKPINQTGLLAEIDRENRQKLAKMSAQELEADLSEVNKILSPNLVEFLKKRSAAKQSKPVVSFQQPVEGVVAPPLESNGDLPVKPRPEWAHMDVVETEKLEWTKDVEVPESADEELKAFEARFDFAGLLAPLPVGDEAEQLPPSSSALYHHGDEPYRPGYTLSELLELARSKSVQQRILALRTLTAICRKARQGVYVAASVSKPILPCLLDAGFAFTIRLALDDSSSEGNAVAALAALEALLVEPDDEDLLQTWQCMGQVSFPFYADHLVAAPLSDEHVKELDDYKMMSKDVVMALVFRTHLLARLRYLLVDWPIPSNRAEITRLILCVLLRISRHSPACAAQMATGGSGRRLMTKVVELIEGPQGGLSLQILTSVAQSAPNLASSLVDVNSLFELIAPSSNLDVAEFDFLKASRCLDLIAALNQTQKAKNMALAIAQRLVEVETVLLSKSEHCPEPGKLRYISSILNLYFPFESDESFGSSFQNAVYGMLEPILVVFPDKFRKWLVAKQSNDEYLLNLLSSAFSLSAAVPAATRQLSQSNSMLNLIDEAILIALHSSVSRSDHSVVLRSFDSTDLLKNDNESPRRLQYLNAVRSAADLPKYSVSSWALSASLFEFLSKFSTDFAIKHLANLEIETYFKLISGKRSMSTFATGFFHLNFEIAFIASYLNCLSSKRWFQKVPMLTSIFAAVLKVLPQISGLFSSTLWDVTFDTFLFNVEVLEKIDVKIRQIQAVRSVYHDSLSGLLSLSSKYCSFSSPALCKDWLYFPLAAAGITTNLAFQSSADDDKLMPAFRHRVVISVLRCVSVVFSAAPQVVFEEMTPVMHLVRLSSLYLHDDVFGGAAGELEGVRNLLSECLSAILKQRASSIYFGEKVPGLDCTLEDFYIALLEQFKAASYGDLVFANILLLFASSRQSISFRRLLWGDHREVLMFMRPLTITDLLVPLDHLLQPFESKLPMIKLYAEFIFGEVLAPGPRRLIESAKSAVWLVAINHLNSFLFDSSTLSVGSKLRKSMWHAAAQQASSIQDLAVQTKLKQLVFYKFTSLDPALDSLQMYESLPQNRVEFLQKIIGEQQCSQFIEALQR